MTQPAYARDHYPLAGTRLRLFQTFVGSDAGTKNRRGIGKGQLVRNPAEVIGLTQSIFSKGTVHGVA